MSKHRYELWLSNQVLARYETLGQALLGALWRSRKQQKTVYVWTVEGVESHCIAKVAAVPEAAYGE